MRLSSLSLIFCALAACGRASPDPVDDPLPYADPRFGSGGMAYAAGSAYPGASAPNGLVKVGPDTNGPYGPIRFLHYSGYWAGDDRIRSLTHLHLHGTGATDYGVLALLPVERFDPARRRVEEYESPFDKRTEQATPGYYAATLLNGDIRIELTATTRAAHHRYTFRADAETADVVLDLAKHLDSSRVEDSELEIIPDEQRLRGRLRSVGEMSRGFGGYDVFFEIRSRTPWTSHQVWSRGEAPSDALSAEGHDIGAVLRFDPSAGPVELQVGVSFVSAEGARANLLAEVPHWEFDATRDRTAQSWRERLSRMRVYGGTEAQRTLFYSALHHAFMMPTTASDTDGRYRFAGAVHETKRKWTFLTDLSLWDTYRTLHPLYSLAWPEQARDSVRSLHAMARARGSFPRWPIATGEAGTMIGQPAEMVLADAWLKGIRDFDIADAYERLRAAAMDDEAPAGGRGGRDAAEEYVRLGYVPATRGRSVSNTIEYAQGDFALSHLARALGHDSDADALLERSRGWRRLWDPATGVLRPHHADGTLIDEPYDATSWTHYAEANGGQSVWGALWDVPGLVELHGGQDAFVAALEAFFEASAEEETSLEGKDELLRNMPRRYYWACNEPLIHVVYLFALAGRPDLTQKWLPFVRDTFYAPTPDGLPGNDDGGTMSAWWVFTALGLYPVVGSDLYVLGAPLFPKVEVAVDGGAFTIEAPGVSEANRWVQRVTLDGRPLERAELRHADLKAGARLVFEMGAEPKR